MQSMRHKTREYIVPDEPDRAYMAVVLKVTDPSWIAEYGPNVDTIMARHGAKAIILSGSVKTLEGEINPDQVALFEFPSMKSLKDFLADPDYAPWKKARQAGSDASIFAFNSMTQLRSCRGKERFGKAHSFSGA
jgi:uncharacterized protein (DUF1330 family)